VQIDPSEEGMYAAGSGRRVFQAGALTFGVAICHEGWRYPETVRWAARYGAHVVFHPHFHEAEPGGYQPYGKRGLLIADIDITEATGLLAARLIGIDNSPRRG
jgi:predicted amidohydrolase